MALQTSLFFIPIIFSGTKYCFFFFSSIFFFFFFKKSMDIVVPNSQPMDGISERTKIYLIINILNIKIKVSLFFSFMNKC